MTLSSTGSFMNIEDLRNKLAEKGLTEGTRVAKKTTEHVYLVQAIKLDEIDLKMVEPPSKKIVRISAKVSNFFDDYEVQKAKEQDRLSFWFFLSS